MNQVLNRWSFLVSDTWGRSTYKGSETKVKKRPREVEEFTLWILM